MSHEIPTPTNAIAGISETALDFNLSYSEKTILQIRSSGEALVGIINDILRLNLAKWNERKYKDYTILVHALKSSARIIGAENLSMQEEYLESFGNQLKTAESGVLVSEMRFTTLILTASWKLLQMLCRL